MKINLKEIPEEGKSFTWNDNTGELVHILTDLIGAAKHQADFTIRPINSRDFELTGSIRTQIPELCSRCGLDFSFPVHQRFHEILIPHQPSDRTGKYARVNHVSESESEGPSSVEYDPNMSIHLGEYLHEQVAIALPVNPAPPEKANGDCSLCDQPVRGKTFSYDEDLPRDEKPKPFEVLKNLKVQ